MGGKQTSQRPEGFRASTDNRLLGEQVAVVTGAGSGIGRAAAIMLAQAGAKVGLIGRRRQPLDEVAAEIEQAGGEGWPLVADVSDRSAVEAALSQCVERGGGRLDVLVNNAGINTKQRSLTTMSPADWEYVVAVNLTGAYWCTRAVLPVMRQQGGGLIINVSSMAARNPGGISGSAYSASKAAMASLNISINQEERRHGIRACMILPGEVDTPIIKYRPVRPSDEARATMMQPEDVGAAVLFVATLPPRATVEEIAMRPTVLRDLSTETERS